MIGHKPWHPMVKARGTITAQSPLKILHPAGMRSVESIIIPTEIMMQITRVGPKRLIIRGTSFQKLERSTSFFVAPHWMLYENVWASKAWDRWILRPPKKKKKKGSHLRHS